MSSVCFGEFCEKFEVVYNGNIQKQCLNLYKSKVHVLVVSFW